VSSPPRAPHIDDDSETPPPLQSVLKAVTWRVVASLDTFIISNLITGSMVFASSIVGVEVVSKMVVYYLHERAWARGWWIWRQRREAGWAARGLERAEPPVVHRESVADT
jgi:uncharacterized membrane protein